MGYGGPDSSGTDDDIPPSYQDRVPRGVRFAGNGKSAVEFAQYPRMHMDMEAQIHHLEQEAYSAVLRAFKAQADAITWEKETLITEFRRELRVSDDEHRELLSKVNADDVIHRIREWREDGRHQATMRSTSHDHAPSSVSASRKKQKTSHSGQIMPGLSTIKAVQYLTTGMGQLTNHGSSGVFVANEAAKSDPLIGRKVWTRWPDDNNFYEAVITDYNSTEGRHALVYDINTADETWEWVDLKEISPDDIRWDDEGPTISNRGGQIRQGRGHKKSTTRAGVYPGGGKGRGSAKGQSRKEVPSQNGNAKTDSDDIQLLNTETLVKEVEKVCSALHPDPIDLQKAKNMLIEHEHALLEAIARLADASDGESDGERQPLSGGELMEPE